MDVHMHTFICRDMYYAMVNNLEFYSLDNHCSPYPEIINETGYYGKCPLFDLYNLRIIFKKIKPFVVDFHWLNVQYKYTFKLSPSSVKQHPLMMKLLTECLEKICVWLNTNPSYLNINQLDVTYLWKDIYKIVDYDSINRESINKIRMSKLNSSIKKPLPIVQPLNPLVQPTVENTSDISDYIQEINLVTQNLNDDISLDSLSSPDLQPTNMITASVWNPPRMISESVLKPTNMRTSSERKQTRMLSATASEWKPISMITAPKLKPTSMLSATAAEWNPCN